MNSKEIEEIRPGQLFQLRSGDKRGIVAVHSSHAQSERMTKTRRLEDGVFLLLVRTSEELKEHPHVKWLRLAAQALDFDESEYADFFEFLTEEELVILTGGQLRHLTEAY
jgi:hypothetical protein